MKLKEHLGVDIRNEARKVGFIQNVVWTLSCSQ